MRVSFDFAYFWVSAAVGLAMLSGGTFLLLSREHWAARARGTVSESYDDRAMLIRKKTTGWGVALVAGGIVALVQGLYTMLV